MNIKFLIYLCGINFVIIATRSAGIPTLSGFLRKKLIAEGKQRLGILNYMIGTDSRDEGRECLVSGRYQDIADHTRNDSCQSRYRHLAQTPVFKVRVNSTNRTPHFSNRHTYYYVRGSGSSDGIAAELWAGRSGIESRWGGTRF